MIAAKVDVPYLFRFLEIAGAVAAIGVMGYTGVLLSSMAAVEFWNTWLLVALFVVRCKLRLRLYLVFRFHPRDQRKGSRR